jgi:glutaredoxin
MSKRSSRRSKSYRRRSKSSRRRSKSSRRKSKRSGKPNKENYTFGFGDVVWEIYTKDGCPHCESAKKTLEKYVENNGGKLNIYKGKENTDENVKKKMDDTKMTTWPRIFKNNELIGGNSDLESYLKQNK